MTAKTSLAAITLAVAGLLSILAAPAAEAQAKAAARPLLIQGADIAKPGPGPHEGQGPTVGFPFSTVAGFQHLYFSTRIMHPGSTVGRHLMDANEVYYLATGEADFIDDQGSRPVKAGTAIFMTPGQTIELRQRGSADVMLVVASSRP